MNNKNKAENHCLAFAKKVQKWVTYDIRDISTVNVIKNLELKQLIECNCYNQFKIKD